jgi:hypothetical protein
MIGCARRFSAGCSALFVLAHRLLELQSALAGTVGNGLHAAVIPITRAVEHHLRDSRRLGPFGKHLATSDLFDTAKFPTARFVSRKETVRGTQAIIAGDLTLRGVTKPLTLDARLHGAGVNGMNKKQTVGFSATGTLKRSDFNLGYAVPAVSDEVKLEITAAFEK